MDRSPAVELGYGVVLVGEGLIFETGLSVTGGIACSTGIASRDRASITVLSIAV